MDAERFTTRAREALSGAVRHAEARENQELAPQHLLLALLDLEPGIERDALVASGVDVAALKVATEAAVDKVPTVTGATNLQPSPSRSLRDVFGAAERLAKAWGDSFVAGEHLLAAVAEVESPARVVLEQQGAPHAELVASIRKLRGSRKVDSPDAEQNYKVLEKYGRDLTALARAGKLDPVIGRDEEIRRVIQV
ncbi:MAG: ATP-dependent chaperone ClpB, partial [Thermoleophilia bacterium]|nr:ATP-dependent chaperone ClpB [Thermoleophilia bacterium]